MLPASTTSKNTCRSRNFRRLPSCFTTNGFAIEYFYINKTNSPLPSISRHTYNHEQYASERSVAAPAGGCQMRMVKNLAACFAFVLAVLFGQGALSQPGRTIKMVVPFPAGGLGDILARLLGEQISRTRGSTLVV